MALSRSLCRVLVIEELYDRVVQGLYYSIEFCRVMQGHRAISQTYDSDVSPPSSCGNSIRFHTSENHLRE